VEHLLKSLSFTNILTDCSNIDKDKKISRQKLLAAMTALLAYQLQGNSTASERKACLWYQDKVFLPNKQSFKKAEF